MKRSSLLVALLATSLLAGCKEPTQSTDSKLSTTFVRGGQDIAIEEVRTYLPGDAVSGSNDEYYVVRFKFTNDLGVPLAPQIDHFTIEDSDKTRYLGVQTGNAALVGISNYSGTLQRGETHEYTVGFRVRANTQGTLFYDASF